MSTIQEQMYAISPHRECQCPTCYPPRKPWPAFRGTDAWQAELHHFKLGQVVRFTSHFMRCNYLEGEPWTDAGTVLELGKRHVLVSWPRGATWCFPGNLQHAESTR